jgi:hypothetical protein
MAASLGSDGRQGSSGDFRSAIDRQTAQDVCLPARAPSNDGYNQTVIVQNVAVI